MKMEGKFGVMSFPTLGLETGPWVKEYVHHLRTGKSMKWGLFLEASESIATHQYLCIIPLRTILCFWLPEL